MSTTSTQTVYKFGTSGWRATDEFTEDAVCHITIAFADFLIESIQKQGKLLPILIGGDTRQKTRQFIPLISQMLKERGLDVYQADTDVPSPVLAYAAKYFGKIDPKQPETLGSILMTASHNPWEYGGYNFLTPDGAVMPGTVSKRVEALQANPLNLKLSLDDRKRFGGNDMSEAQIRTFNPYDIYKEHLIQGLKINFEAIKKGNLSIHYDALYATGRLYFPRILKEESGIDIKMIHGTDQLPANYSGMPEPTGSELAELSENVKKDTGKLVLGVANDGDSDRFGVLDENGKYLNPNEVLLLIMHHLTHNKKQTGVIVRSQATTNMLDALASKLGLQVIQTPVGYKYIAAEFEHHEEDPSGPQVLIGGESSGGLSVLGHLPEKDGILANLLIAELVAVEQRPLSVILEEVHATLGKRYLFRELGVKTEHGTQVKEHFQKLQTTGGTFAGAQINAAKSEAGSKRLESAYGTRDGAKLIFDDGSWLLIRASGTEPIVRVYVEGVGPTPQAASDRSQAMLDAIQNTLAQDFQVPAGSIKEKK